MSLFQKSVEKKYLNELDTILIDRKYKDFQSYFGNPAIQENIQKAKIKLTLSEEADWMNYFNEQKEKAQTLKSEIEKTDREIDRMVYELYDLTDEEIKIVEESV